jgi:hypothetical protein
VEVGVDEYFRLCAEKGTNSVYPIINARSCSLHSEEPFV